MKDRQHIVSKSIPSMTNHELITGIRDLMKINKVQVSVFTKQCLAELDKRFDKKP